MAIYGKSFLGQLVRAKRRVAGWVALWGYGLAGMITSDDWDHSRKFPA